MAVWVPHPLSPVFAGGPPPAFSSWGRKGGRSQEHLSGPHYVMFKGRGWTEWAQRSLSASALHSHTFAIFSLVLQAHKLLCSQHYLKNFLLFPCLLCFRTWPEFSAIAHFWCWLLIIFRPCGGQINKAVDWWVRVMSTKIFILVHNQVPEKRVV